MKQILANSCIDNIFTGLSSDEEFEGVCRCVHYQINFICMNCELLNLLTDLCNFLLFGGVDVLLAD